MSLRGASVERRAVPGDHPAARVERAARNALLLAALARAVRALSEQSIRAIAIKGSALLAGRTVPRWARHLDDVDLWVAPAEARHAWDVLSAAGFARADARVSVTHNGVDSLEAPTHQLPLLRSEHGALVELHTASHADGSAGNFDDCWATASDVAVFDSVVRVPSVLHTLEHVCAHVVEHHFGDLRLWPRHVEDVRALVRQEPTLATLRNRRDAVGLSLRILDGADRPESRDAWLAQAILSPRTSTTFASQVLALLARVERFAAGDTRTLLRALFPVASHLSFTGDLAGDRGAAAAHVRRWRRIASRLRSSMSTQK
jgi:hypothetical protein